MDIYIHGCNFNGHAFMHACICMNGWKWNVTLMLQYDIEYTDEILNILQRYWNILCKSCRF